MKEWSEKIIARKERIAISIILDLSVEAEAFGSEIRFSENSAPRVVGRLILNKEDIDLLEVPTLDKGRVYEYIKANRKKAEGITKEPIFASCVGPFTLANMLYGMAEIKEDLYLESEAIKQLLEKCTAFITNYCQALKDTGVNGVMIAEPTAGLLNNDLCQEFSSDFVKRIVEAVQDDSFMMILHNCGNSGHCTAAVTSVGAMGYHYGDAIDMVKALETSPKEALAEFNESAPIPLSVRKRIRL